MERKSIDLFPDVHLVWWVAISYQKEQASASKCFCILFLFGKSKRKTKEMDGVLSAGLRTHARTWCVEWLWSYTDITEPLLFLINMFMSWKTKASHTCCSVQYGAIINVSYCSCVCVLPSYFISIKPCFKAAATLIHATAALPSRIIGTLKENEQKLILKKKTTLH